MSRRVFFALAILAFIQLSLSIALSPPSLAQEWTVRGKQQGTLKVVDLGIAHAAVCSLYTESLVGRGKDKIWVPRLAEDWRWLDERTVEFKLRRGVTFQNGEKFGAESVRVNWEAYRKMENPTDVKFGIIPDETALQCASPFLSLKVSQCLSSGTSDNLRRLSSASIHSKSIIGAFCLSLVPGGWVRSG